MDIKFYREKNALKIKNAEVTTPNHDDLEFYLIQKIQEKVFHISTIADPIKRKEYLTKKNKLSEAEKMTERQVVNFLSQRLAADLMQLAKDLSELYNIKPCKNANTLIKKQPLEDIECDLLECANNLKTDGDKKYSIDLIYKATNNYLLSMGLQPDYIERLRFDTEITEGTFLNGKLVRYK